MPDPAFHAVRRILVERFSGAFHPETVNDIIFAVRAVNPPAVADAHPLELRWRAVELISDEGIKRAEAMVEWAKRLEIESSLVLAYDYRRIVVEPSVLGGFNVRFETCEPEIPDPPAFEGER